MQKSNWARLVVILTKALHGHPDSGTFWEYHCDKESRKVGFKPIGPTWPSCDFHQKLEFMLMVSNSPDQSKISNLDGSSCARGFPSSLGVNQASIWAVLKSGRRLP